MFRSNEEKISLARAILRDNKGTPEHFLSKCREAGIMHGNRDTQDELWEFKEYVLTHVPGCGHAYREALIYELEAACRDECKEKYSLRQLGLILDALIRDGNSATSATLMTKRESVIDAFARITNSMYRVAAENFLPHEHISTTFITLRVKLDHACSFCYISDAGRRDAMTLTLDAEVLQRLSGNRGFAYVHKRYLNSHIGLFGYDRSQVAAVMTSRVWYYKYRVGTWAAVADFLVENGVLCNLTDFWETSFAFTHDVTSPAKSFPGASEFIKENKADWKVIGRMVPGFYRAYEETKERLLAKA